MRHVAAFLLAAPAAAETRPPRRDTGPGRGPWETATPESQGLDSAALRAAEQRVRDSVGGRVCYLVVKNGRIVHETYYDGWTESSTRQGYSTTKSQCSSLYGIAREQGWAQPSDRVAARNTGTRQCNPAAEFRHVLTMTGESADIGAPRFSYDTNGNRCLDTISDFIAQNNPEGLSTVAFKDKYWQEPLGLEHTEWTGGSLPCGSGSVLSCRDLARTALLWTNDGYWPGAGQMLSQQHVEEGRKWVFPQSGTDYGYTVWLSSADPVDNEMAIWGGMFSQCASASPRHNAVVVSMGMEIIGEGCGGAWAHSAQALVSKRHPLYANITQGPRPEIPPVHPPTREDVLQLRGHVRSGAERLNTEQMKVLNGYLRKLGEPELE